MTDQDPEGDEMHDELSVEFRPELIDDTAFIACGAVVRGEVRIGPDSSVWFGTVIRGDVAAITIGRGSNVQDLSVLHADPGYPCTIGDHVTIGHGAIVHGATVEDEALVGIRAVVLNGAVVGRGSIVGAGAVVTEGTEIPPNHLAVGIPAKVVRELTEEDRARLRRGAEHYVRAAAAYRQHEGELGGG